MNVNFLKRMLFYYLGPGLFKQPNMSPRFLHIVDVNLISLKLIRL